MSDLEWIPFFFDSNGAFGEVDSPEAWGRIVAKMTAHYRSDFRRMLLEAREAPSTFIHPSDLIQGQRTRDPIPNFGWRREHVGRRTLGEWADAVGMGRLIRGPLEAQVAAQ